MPLDRPALRAQLRAARRARTDAQRAADAQALAAIVLAAPAVAAARVVALYASTPTEPGTGPLRAALAARGVRVLLPVVTGDAPLGWVEDRTDPGAAADLRDADVVLVPALAVDAAGTRLGQGGGHYDRTLAALAAASAADPADRRRPAPLVAALVHDGELLPAGALVAEAHDVPVTAAATPTRWHGLGPAAAAR